MFRQSDSPLQDACQARFPAWTLYARTFCGNRSDAEDLVRGAVSRTLQRADPDNTAADLHGRVLWDIRASAVRHIESAGGAGLLEMISGSRDQVEARRVADLAHEQLGRLPRPVRQALDGTLLRRPPRSLRRQASTSGVDPETLSERLDEGLARLAEGLRRVAGRNSSRTGDAGPGRAARKPADRGAGGDGAAGGETPRGAHVRLGGLLAYVQGALSGDEARAVAAHAGGCVRCGDRLGGMMLLRSRATERVRTPRVPRSWKLAGLGLALAGLVLLGAVTVPRLLPNPWADHATRETVPRWYHDFFYGGGRSLDDRLVARGLDLLVQGRYGTAVELLEPLLERRPRDAEVAAYLGIARYLQGDSSGETVDLLDRGTGSGRAGRLAGWYLANVRLARGEIVQARRQLEALAWIGDWVGREARALLDRLDRASAGAAAAEATA